MQKTYNPQEIEQKIYQQWEQSGDFKASGQGQPYSIVLPPPNVTGSLHMGHGFQGTLMDALIRYHRMLGNNTLWQVGVDHAGIATQMVVENQLAKQGKKRHDLGREAFLETAFKWKEQSGGNITRQLRRLGASADWPRERFTLDPHYAETVKQVFIKLYDEGLIYRGKRLVNWDPHFKTAISNLEVNSEEENGSLWHLRYPLADGGRQLIVATTRPETMLGDTAVAVNPKDQRYKNLIGKKIKLPLTEREIPIIADDYVDMEFGTGCVKITPAHDFNDYEMGKRHDLPLINIFTDEAHLNENAPQKYQGLERFAARKQIIADLKAAELLEKIEPHKLKVPRNDRGNNIVEPYLTDQWYVKAKPLAKPAIDAVNQGKTKFIPENWTKIYYQWMENIEDWCISRQLWWGHRIPAWYDEAGNIYVAEDEAAARKKYQLTDNVKLSQDEDVLDTWFSSGLWPFVTLGWPEKTPELESFYPTSVLVTGFDIIFFWVARMMMMGLHFMKDVPFKEVYITGLIRDAHGHKMSKTKGNVLDPIDLIDGVDLETLVHKRTYNLMQESSREKAEKLTRKEFPNGISAYGTDALRFTYCSIASTGRDIRFDVKRLEGYRNFCNKLWNAARYVQMANENHHYQKKEDQLDNLNVADQWILSKLQETIKEAHRHFENYRFDLLSQMLYDFTWHEYCDWYVELSKAALNDDSKKAATLATLNHTLKAILKLLHPIIPFVTEEIWQSMATGSIMLADYPQADEQLLNTSAVNEIEWIKQFVIAIRNIRGEMNIKPGKALPVLLQKGNATDQKYVEQYRDYLISLAKLDSITWFKEKAPACATALVGELEILIPMSDLIDKEAELKRLEKEIEKLQKDQQHLQSKLNNPNFVDKAPAAIIDKHRAELEETETALSKLMGQLEELRWAK